MHKVKARLVLQMADAPVRRVRLAPDQAENFQSFVPQQVGQQAAVLAADASDKCALHRTIVAIAARLARPPAEAARRQRALAARQLKGDCLGLAHQSGGC